MRLKHWLRAEADDGTGGSGGDTTTADTATTTVLTDTTVDTTTTKTADATKTAPATWPDDWRDKAAGGDAKKAARLSTYASPSAVADALIAAQNRIAAGDLKVALNKDAKPEEVAAYRAAHGIPEAPDKYDLTGVALEGVDKELVGVFLGAAHGENMTPSQVRTSLESYAKITETLREKRTVLDNEAKEKAEDALRAEWGNEFRTNVNLVMNLIGSAPQGVGEKLLHGRLSDGTPIGSSPEVLQFLVGLARERNPAGVVVPSGVATESAVEDEIAKYEKLMRTDRAAYNKVEGRYRQLLEWRETQKRRVA